LFVAGLTRSYAAPADFAVGFNAAIAASGVVALAGAAAGFILPRRRATAQSPSLPILATAE
jgi:hypothetical protein